MEEERVRIGVIGGSGLYELEGLRNVREVRLNTPFGRPSDSYVIGTLEGVEVAFLPRHGRGHRIMPTEVNSRANIWGFKKLGVEYLISVTACGSMKEQYAPGHVVIPDQVFDRTTKRIQTFFGNGIVVHVSMAEPFCPYLSRVLYDAVKKTGNPVHMGGTFLVIEGPRFSTKGESRVFRQWGVDIIGMTAVPEVSLAREAGISYAAMAHVTDYDVWHESEEPVTAEKVIQTLSHNVEIAKEALRNAILALKDAPPSPYADALKDAIITRPDAIPPAVKAKLDLLIGKYLK
jgi:5'-methylthioadenosine phosphorylase